MDAFGRIFVIERTVAERIAKAQGDHRDRGGVNDSAKRVGKSLKLLRRQRPHALGLRLTRGADVGTREVVSSTALAFSAP